MPNLHCQYASIIYLHWYLTGKNYLQNNVGEESKIFHSSPHKANMI